MSTDIQRKPLDRLPGESPHANPLPLQRGEGETSSVYGAAHVADPFVSQEKILLVDDVPSNLAVLSLALEPEGYEILAAPSGAAAIKVAAKAKPDLILLDIMMPDMDGVETCLRLKQDEATRDSPVIFITARADAQSVVQGFRAGAVDYLVKPLQTDEVLIRVKTHLRAWKPRVAV